MSFRERTAWITMIAILGVSLTYWLHVPSLLDPHPDHHVLHAMGASAVAYALIELVAYIVLRVRYPQDARTPKDERERLIDLKAVRVAYHFFVTGAIGGMFVTLHVIGADTIGLGMVVFMSFVFSQVAKHAARIVYYRRGA